MEHVGDYITRAEFEERIQALICRGDQQTIDVESGPGGQTIRSIQVIGDDPTTDTEYVTISYDSGTEQFTIAITDMPYQLLRPTNFSATGTSRRDEYPYVSTLNRSDNFFNKTFVFNKPTTSCLINVFIRPHMDASDTDQSALAAYWSPGGGGLGGLTGADTTTTDRYVPFPDGTESTVFQATLLSDGTYTKFTTLTEPPVLGDSSGLPMLYVTSASNLITLPGFTNISYSVPYAETIYLGRSVSDGSLIISDDTADFLPALPSKAIGEVEIDASNIVRLCTTYKKTIYPPSVPIGFTGTIGPTETTLVREGIIYGKS